MDQVRKLLSNDRFALGNGIELVDVSPGYAKTRMPITEQHLNGVNTAQGGAIFTLADLAFAAACNSHGTIAVAVNVSISFMKAATKGTLVAEAKEVTINPRLGTYAVTVTDDEGDVVAVFQGMAYRKKNPLSDFVT